MVKIERGHVVFSVEEAELQKYLNEGFVVVKHKKEEGKKEGQKELTPTTKKEEGKK